MITSAERVTEVNSASPLKSVNSVHDLTEGASIGASLPELASSLMAVKKGEHDSAIGNVIGSNMFHTLAVVGIAGTIQPRTVGSEFLYRDVMVMFASTIALFIFCIGIKRQGRLNRLEGGAFVLAYAAYTYWLIQAAFI